MTQDYRLTQVSMLHLKKENIIRKSLSINESFTLFCMLSHVLHLRINVYFHGSTTEALICQVCLFGVQGEQMLVLAVW